MSHRIALENNLAIIQLATPKGITFRLIKENGPDEVSELLDEKYDAMEILHAAERFQNSQRFTAGNLLLIRTIKRSSAGSNQRPVT